MGRKPKYENPDQTIQSFFAAVSESYHSPGRDEVGDAPGKKKLELLAEEFGISRIKVRKILVTAGDIAPPAAIASLLSSGYAIRDVAEALHMSESAVNSWAGYSKGVYNLSEVSAAAARTKTYRARRQAIKELERAVEAGEWRLALWKAITRFAGYPFTTSGRGSRPGVKFRYTVSGPGGAGGKHYDGEDVEGFGNEMWVITSEGEKKKSISRSTAERAMKTALEMGGRVKGPKALNVPGAHSYLYPIFVRFGVIEV